MPNKIKGTKITNDHRNSGKYNKAKKFAITIIKEILKKTVRI